MQHPNNGESSKKRTNLSTPSTSPTIDSSISSLTDSIQTPTPSQKRKKIASELFDTGDDLSIDSTGSERVKFSSQTQETFTKEFPCVDVVFGGYDCPELQLDNRAVSAFFKAISPLRTLCDLVLHKTGREKEKSFSIFLMLAILAVGNDEKVGFCMNTVEQAEDGDEDEEEETIENRSRIFTSSVIGHEFIVYNDAPSASMTTRKIRGIIAVKHYLNTSELLHRDSPIWQFLSKMCRASFTTNPKAIKDGETLMHGILTNDERWIFVKLVKNTDSIPSRFSHKLLVSGPGNFIQSIYGSKYSRDMNVCLEYLFSFFFHDSESVIPSNNNQQKRTITEEDVRAMIDKLEKKQKHSLEEDLREVERILNTSEKRVTELEREKEDMCSSFIAFFRKSCPTGTIDECVTKTNIPRNLVEAHWGSC